MCAPRVRLQNSARRNLLRPSNNPLCCDSFVGHACVTGVSPNSAARVGNCTKHGPPLFRKNHATLWSLTQLLCFRFVSEQFSFSLAITERKMAHCVSYIPFATHSELVRSSMHKISEGVRSTHGQDGAIVLDVQQGQMFNLNLVGSRILELLEAGTPEAVIADEISRQFEVSRDTANQDMQEFIDALKERGLVKETK